MFRRAAAAMRLNSDGLDMAESLENAYVTILEFAATKIVNFSAYLNRELKGKVEGSKLAMATILLNQASLGAGPTEDFIINVDTLRVVIEARDPSMLNDILNEKFNMRGGINLTKINPSVIDKIYDYLQMFCELNKQLETVKEKHLNLYCN